MKLLDPFAGYRLASGHPFFHIALFTGSWMIIPFGDKAASFDSTKEIDGAFKLLRWSHFGLFCLALIEGYLNLPSNIDKKEKKESSEDDDKDMEKLKLYHRDGSFKLFARVCATISVFLYQGAIFFA